MATRKRPATRKPAAKKRPARRKPVARKQLARRPRGGSFGQRAATWLALFIARQAEGHRATVRTRKDAAILRTTHAGCAKCHGTGTIATHDKKGLLTGSKSCDAKPSQVKVSRAVVARQARFGPDKRSGLMGWKCPCGKGEKPRYRDAKTASEALKSHERKIHGGATIGGAWYMQLPETAKPASSQNGPKPMTQPAPTSKVVATSGMTDEQWIKQNKGMAPATAMKKGLCWQCAGQGRLFSAFGGQQTVNACSECKGTGKAATATATA
jgi:hypothetical protein